MNSLINKFEVLVSTLYMKSQELYHSSVRTERFSKNQNLLRGGSICDHTYVVLEGCMRKYYLKNGMEITSEFVFPGEMAVSVSSFLHRKPSKEFVQTIEATEAMMIPYHLVQVMQHVGKQGMRRPGLVRRFVA